MPLANWGRICWSWWRRFFKDSDGAPHFAPELQAHRLMEFGLQCLASLSQENGWPALGQIGEI